MAQRVHIIRVMKRETKKNSPKIKKIIRCNGTMRNGPGKRYSRCSKCGSIDWELYEGDQCRAFIEAR